MTVRASPAVTRYPSCDECGFGTAYPVNTETGLIRLCGGCMADLRRSGHRAELEENVHRAEYHYDRITHCPAGHPYSPENTYVLSSRPNARYCRACHKIHARNYARRKAEQRIAA